MSQSSVEAPASEEVESELWLRRDEPEVREKLALRFMSQAKRTALRYQGQAEPLEDLIQVANLGLMSAIERFDPSRGIPFAAFASPTIHGELKRHFRDRVSTMRVPRAVYERIGDVESVVADLRSSLAREPSTSEIAEAMGCAEEDVLEAREAAQVRNPVGFGESHEDDEHDGPTEEHLGTEDDGYELAEDRLVTGEALQELDPRDRAIVTLRFREELTQSQIAERLDCSQMQVSRRLKSILGALRDKVNLYAEA